MWDPFYVKATVDPAGLIEELRVRTLSERDLGRAAEALGSTVQTPEAMAALLGLFNHSSAFVRACAIYGLSHFMDERVVQSAVGRAFELDLDAAVKDAARDVLRWVKSGRRYPFVPSMLLVDDAV